MSLEVHPILDAGVSPKPGMWYAVSPEGGHEPPSARVGASAMEVVGAGTIWLCGGATLDGAFSDLFELKITSDSISWSKLPSDFLPARYEHIQALSPAGEVLVFAGSQENNPLNDMWKYDRDAGQWREVAITAGSPPSPRTNHSSTCMWKEKIVVFSGGHSGTETTDNCLYIFDTVTSSWHSPPTTGTPPTPRQGHLVAVIGDKFYVYGGMATRGLILGDLHILTLDTLEWTQPEATGTPPPALAGHACAIIGKRLYLFGGLSDKGTTDSLYYLDTEGLVWTKVEVEGAPPPCRLDLSMCTFSLPVPRVEGGSSSTSLQKDSTPSEVPSDVAPPLPQQSSPPHTDTAPPPPTSTSSESPLPPHPSPPHIVTVLSPETGSEAGTTAVPPSGNDSTNTGEEVAAPGAMGGKREYLSEGESADGGGPLETVTALFVFGGVEASGYVYSDCFIIVPP